MCWSLAIWSLKRFSISASRSSARASASVARLFSSISIAFSEVIVGKLCGIESHGQYNSCFAALLGSAMTIIPQRF